MLRKHFFSVCFWKIKALETESKSIHYSVKIVDCGKNQLVQKYFLAQLRKNNSLRAVNISSNVVELLYLKSKTVHCIICWMFLPQCIERFLFFLRTSFCISIYCTLDMLLLEQVSWRYPTTYQVSIAANTAI